MVKFNPLATTKVLLDAGQAGLLATGGEVGALGVLDELLPVG